MPRRKQTPESQMSLLEHLVKTAPCVPAIKKAVDEWRAENYEAVKTSNFPLERLQ